MSQQTTPQATSDGNRQAPVREHADRPERPASGTTVKVLAGGSTAEALAGIGAGALAILGLVDVAPQDMASIATIAIGGGLLVRGSAVAARTKALMGRVGTGDEATISSGIGVEVAAGIAAIALGVLSFLSVNAAVLLPSALIAAGAAMMLGAAATRQIDEVTGGLSNRSGAALDADVGAEVLVGIGAVVLGIIALVGGAFNVNIVLVGLLAVGAAMLLESVPGLVRLAGVGR